MHNWLRTAVFLLLFIQIPALASTVWHLNATGQLSGASRVLIEGQLYDVSFQADTCINTFDGCDGADDFLFQTAAGATAASEALLDQIFVDVAAGMFDSNPLLVVGCENATTFCSTFTAYAASGSSVLLVSAGNDDDEPQDGVGMATGLPINFDLGTSVNTTWAVWSEHTAVPLPASVWLLLSALVPLVRLAQISRSRIAS